MPDSICRLPGSPAKTSFYICLIPVYMIPRLRMWRAPPYPAGTETSSPRMQRQAAAGIRTWISSIKRFSSTACQPNDIRVAAYGRVSTDELAQQTSYEGQKSYYTKLINEKEGWTFAGMYADALFSCPDAVKWHGQSVLHSTSTCSMTEPAGVLFSLLYRKLRFQSANQDHPFKGWS